MNNYTLALNCQLHLNIEKKRGGGAITVVELKLLSSSQQLKH